MNKSNPLFTQMRANRVRLEQLRAIAMERNFRRCELNYRRAFAGELPTEFGAGNFAECVEIAHKVAAEKVAHEEAMAALDAQIQALTLASVAATEAVHFAKTGEIRRYTADCRTGAIAWGAPV